MIGFNFGTAKSLFFDRQVVLDSMDKAERKVLSKFGAFVRKRARTSIRKRKKPSAPGTPPSSHVGSLRRGILFAFEPEQHTVVIGPLFFPKGTGKRTGVIQRSHTVPEILEYGGTLVKIRKVFTPTGPGKKAKSALQAAAYLRKLKAGEIPDNRPFVLKEEVANYPARPYMGPAFEAELPGVERLWQDAVV